MSKDTKCIPKGMYCYTYINNKYVKCPYWRQIKDRPEQYDGWCDYLEEGDLELMKGTEATNCKTGEIVKVEDLPFPTSLLWDMCKECGINEPTDEELESEFNE